MNEQNNTWFVVLLLFYPLLGVAAHAPEAYPTVKKKEFASKIPKGGKDKTFFKPLEEWAEAEAKEACSETIPSKNISGIPFFKTLLNLITTDSALSVSLNLAAIPKTNIALNQNNTGSKFQAIEEKKDRAGINTGVAVSKKPKLSEPESGPRDYLFIRASLLAQALEEYGNSSNLPTKCEFNANIEETFFDTPEFDQENFILEVGTFLNILKKKTSYPSKKHPQDNYTFSKDIPVNEKSPDTQAQPSTYRIFHALQEITYELIIRFCAYHMQAEARKFRKLEKARIEEMKKNNVKTTKKRSFAVLSIQECLIRHVYDKFFPGIECFFRRMPSKNFRLLKSQILDKAKYNQEPKIFQLIKEQLSPPTIKIIPLHQPKKTILFRGSASDYRYFFGPSPGPGNESPPKKWLGSYLKLCNNLKKHQSL